MSLAAERKPRAVTDAAHPLEPNLAPRSFAAVSALALMVIAANCFLKYLWWAAKYSAFTGIPKLAAQWQTARAHAAFNGWSFIVLEVVSFLLIYIAIRSRQTHLFRNALRLLASLVITMVGTGLFALALSWIKQSH
jgi:Na+/phosphate symporter